MNNYQTAAVFDKVDFDHPVFLNLFAKEAKKQVNLRKYITTSKLVLNKGEKQ
jgi:hypothetical protein